MLDLAPGGPPGVLRIPPHFFREKNSYFYFFQFFIIFLFSLIFYILLFFCSRPWAKVLLNSSYEQDLKAEVRNNIKPGSPSFNVITLSEVFGSCWFCETQRSLDAYFKHPNLDAYFLTKNWVKNLVSQKVAPTDFDPKFGVKIGWGNFLGHQIFDPIFGQKISIQIWMLKISIKGPLGFTKSTTSKNLWECDDIEARASGLDVVTYLGFEILFIRAV